MLWKPYITVKDLQSDVPNKASANMFARPLCQPLDLGLGRGRDLLPGGAEINMLSRSSAALFARMCVCLQDLWEIMVIDQWLPTP